MKPTVYIDVLFLINFLINLLLLYSTAKLVSVKITILRGLTSSMLGALYSVLIFLPSLNLIYSGVAKFLFSLAIVALAFNIKGIKLYFKTLGVFYIVTLCFGGSIFALFYLTGIGSKVGAVIRNGVLYFDLPWQFLIVSVLISYTVISGVWRFVFSRSVKSTYINICISYLGKTATLKALVDTGNSLHDPLSNSPVIIAEYFEICNILPDDFNEYFEKGCDIERITPGILTRLRIIPYCSLGNENGLLIGFKPDVVTANINENITEIHDVIIGISGNRLSKDKNFQSLLPPGIIF